MNKRKILSPNSGYERSVELNKLFTDFVELNEGDIAVLNYCTTEVPEEIGLVGCILKQNNYLNNARLLIGSLHQYNFELADRANQILNRSEEEIKTLIDEIAERFLEKSDELSKYENKVYSILFGVLYD